MKKILLYLITLSIFSFTASFARNYTGIQAQRLVAGAELVRTSTASQVPSFIQFRQGSEVPFSMLKKWAHATFKLNSKVDFKIINTETDKLGYTHYRYQQMVNSVPVEGSMLVVHVKNNQIEAVSGFVVDQLNSNSAAATINETDALNEALQFLPSTLYRWQVPFWESQIKAVNNNSTATWYPKGEMVYAPLNGIYKNNNYHLCFKFDVYSEKPLARKYIFVDAATGKVIHSLNRIQHTNTLATAVTAYSGVREITTDSVNPTTYHLRETGRGLGIETYDLQQGTNYVNTDFTDADNYWNNTNAQLDEYATDAHWGAEKTWDFYDLKFSRNSVDNAGQKLLSYVHYDVNYVNAFWDGTEMTYGDGDGTYTPLTSLDVTGHEISHGVTEFTAGLVYQDEPGALNESFSDCMGNAIRYFGKQPGTIDWLIGNEIGGTPFRSMSNPNQYGDPDTYLGTNYYLGPNDNGGVHTNSGVQNFFFYLLTEGGTGTNDIGSAYNVTGIGIDNAAAILYRAWSVYMFPNAQYADSRFCCIQAAIDLFGPCTPEVIATTNAWYAVGVGNAFVAGVQADFVAPVTSYCTIPADVTFLNASNNAGYFTWDFGDGNTSTQSNPVHTYTTWGNFTVKLIADGGSCGIDSITKTAFISVDSLNPCTLTLLVNAVSPTQTSCAGQLFDSGGPSANYQDNNTSSVTISPIGAANITLTFNSFDMELNFDYLYVYAGPNTTSPLIGKYSGNTLPNGGSITVSGGSVTLVQTSDAGLNFAGFDMNWQCTLSSLPPTANFTSNTTSSCSGDVTFTDKSTNGPTGWSWDFGDGNYSPLQNPTHTYLASGVYNVKLIASNAIGSDSLIKSGFITINFPASASASGTTICSGYSAILTGTGSDSLIWYDVATGGTPLGGGNTFTTPVLNSTSTFFVENDIFPAKQYVGPVDTSFGPGSMFTNNYYHDIQFDCYTPIKLISVQVYAQGAGIRTITLTDAGGAIINSIDVNIPDGASRIYLNFDLPVANNLELGCTNYVDLYRNQGGAQFPYNLAGVISLKGTNAGDPGYYYYFYDWELQGVPCESPRIPVVVNVDQSPVASFNTSGPQNIITFNDNSTNALSWKWFFGDGDSSSVQSPTHTYTASGTYNVMLIVTNGNCTDTAFQSLTVVVIGISTIENPNGISVYPNPVQENLVINFSSKLKSTFKLTLMNMIGETVSETSVTVTSKTNNFEWNISKLKAGVYTLIADDGERKFIEKVIKE